MRKHAWQPFIVMILLLSFLSSCSDLDIGNDMRRPWGMGDATFGIFCETVPLGVQWNVDTALDIWYDSGGGMTLDEVGGAPGGIYCWKLTGTGTWMGFGVRTEPLVNYRNLNAFRNGRLHFWHKGTKGFKVGIKSTTNNSGEVWLSSSRLISYGLKLDGSWSEVNIPLSAFRAANSNLNLSNMNQYFMWVADTGFGYSAGDVHYLDEIYWKSDYSGPTNDSFDATNYGLYSDSVETSVVWDNNCKLDIWSDYNAAIILTNITGDSGEGPNSWKLTGTGEWMGMGIRVNPEGTYSDMAEYAQGSLRFMVKGTNSFRIGLKSGASTTNWMGPVQISNLGYIPDGTWRTVVIPMTHFTNVDFTKISQYFMFVCDAGLGYQNGIVFYLDHVYWSKVTN